MAQAGEIQRQGSISRRVRNSFRSKSSNAQTSPTFEQLLQRDGSKWSRISSQKNSHDQDNNKTSVLAKVKEKAKKLKYSLTKKKHHDDFKSTRSTRSSRFDPKDIEEDDAEYHSARTSESKQTHASTHKNHLEISKDEPTSSGNKKTETQLKNQAPSETSIVAADPNTKDQTVATTDVAKVPELPNNDSRFSSLAVTTREGHVTEKDDKNIENGRNAKGESKTRDKAVSVKEYLMHKFEPGEDERALSKVITQKISPRRYKAREAMSSFLKTEEISEANKSNVDNNVNVNFKSKSLPTSTNVNTETGSKNASLKQTYSLCSNDSKASLNLNQSFRSTFASYQSHFTGSSTSHVDTNLNSSTTSSSPNTNSESNGSLTSLHSPTKTSSLPLGKSPDPDLVPSGDQKRVPNYRTATSVRRVHVSSVNRTRVPISATNQTQVPDDSETRSRVSA